MTATQPIKTLQSSPAQKYFVKTLGCQMNVYDSEKMAQLLETHLNMIPTEQPEDADILILNTCSIREKAQEKVFDQLGRWRILKAKKPGMLIGVGGCVASQEGGDILKRAQYVDLVFGPQTLHRLPQMILEARKTQKSQVDISFPEIEKFDCLPAPKAQGIKAYVSIMEGCSKYCSFCVVPYTRGEEVSRPFEDVLKECGQLVEQGIKEITLLGQNVNHYQGRLSQGGVADLALLIRALNRLPTLALIRFTTSHPVEFSESLIEAYRDIPKLANHLHLPVQSGSDRILALMKRGHTALEYKSKIRKLKQIRPDITISTDIIVGFPGESDQDFEATLDLVKAIGFDQSFTFLYSPRPGTPATDLVDETPLAIKKARLDQLQDLIHQQTNHISQSMIGSTHKILIESTDSKNPEYVMGRTENNRITTLKGPARWIGHQIPVKITGALTYALKGEAVMEKD